MEKKEIVNKLNEGILKGTYEKILEYETNHSTDIDVFCQKAIWSFLNGDMDEAVRQLEKALEINPYYIDALYNMGVIYRQIGKFGKAYEYFFKALKLDPSQKQCENDLNHLIGLIKQKEKSHINDIQEEIKYIEEQKKTDFSTALMAPWGFGRAKDIGTRLITNPDYFVAEYTRVGFSVEHPTMSHSRVELRKIMKAGSSVDLDVNEPHLVPITLDKVGALVMQSHQKTYTMIQAKDNFIGYCIKEPMNFFASNSGTILMGEPIPLKKDKNKKSLILTIFVDGLSQKFLEENGLENVMPKTYQFFANGIYCTNFYSTAEWTYPSMAAYFTGQYSVDHKMFYPDYDYRLPDNIKVLGECLKDAGYHTAKIDGDWRTNPDYGHIRGMDRVVTATYGEAMHIKEVIYEAMDHMEAMKDTNQFLYLNIGELHDISDHYKLPMDVQMRINLDDLQDERYSGSTSVKQKFNQAKKNRYREQMKYVDRYLGILYDYLKENFLEDEIIVTLFSDHGQGFLVPEGGFFLDDERSKVPLLIKAGRKGEKECTEYISIVDYLPILASLADFTVDNERRSSELPHFFGGEPTRKFVVSESIYPGDTYKIALRNKELVFFLETKNPVQKDAMIDLSEYTYSLKTPQGEIIKNENKVKECIDYVIEHIGYFRMQ